MKKSIVIILCYFLCCLATTSEARVEFTLVDTDGNTVGNVYPVKQGETITMTLKATILDVVPALGLMSMGYSLRYNSQGIVPDAGKSWVDPALWPDSSFIQSGNGVIDVYGARIWVNMDDLDASIFLPPILGPGIPLGTFSFTKIQARGRVQFTLQELMTWYDEDPLDAVPGAWVNLEDMVTGGDSPVALDAEIPWGLVVGTFTDPGDYDGDGDVDGKDLYNLKKDACPTTCNSGVIQDFVKNFGY